jgi:HK97 family phage portal protein
VFYAERLVSGAGGLVGLNPLNPASVTPHYSGKDLIYRWQESGQGHVDFRPDELLIRRGDWTRPSRMAVALATIDGDSAQTDYVRSFFNNGGVPAGRIKIKGTLSQDKADAIRNRWRAMFGRGGRQHDVAVFDDNGDYEKLGANLDELESAIVRGVSESRICMTFQVPPLIVYSYFGLSRSTYSNMDAAMRGFWMNTMSPLLKDWRAWLTWNVLREYESEERILSEDVRLGWDLSKVAALADDVEATQARARANYAAGLISQNEARASIGAAPLDGGDATFASRAAAPLALISGGKGRKAKPAGVEKQMQSALDDYLLEQYRTAAQALA